MQPVRNLLEIYIITYNRSFDLVETVRGLLQSPFSVCNITILDNNSPDDTAEKLRSIVAENPQVRHVRNVINIGAGANAIQPFLMSGTPYTWVVCDDDYLDFSQTDDVLAALQAGLDKLVIVGGHAEPVRLGAGARTDPASLIGQGLNYFRDTSFLPSTIYSTAFARTYLAECYAFCALHYPHVAILLGAYREGVSCYVSKTRLVTPSIGTQSYSQTAQMRWWFGLADTISSRAVRRQFLASQFVGLMDRTGLYGLFNTLVRMRLYGKAFTTLQLFNFRMIGAFTRMIRARARGIRYR